ncbi:MAG: tetratricopeptide repeat protein, partial [Gammaproteobacteria bacterium]
MPNYRVPQYHRYHDSLISEYFWQLENVMDVLRGRAQHQQRFKEATLSTVFSVMQNAGTIGSTVSAAGGVVLGFLGQYQESRRVETLTPEYLSGQWEELKKMVETTAEKAVEQYRYFLERCSEGDAVELGRVSAQRLWEYIPREKLSFTIENMLIGILKGRSGRWQDDWRNTGLTESAESKRQTAEGALKHAGIAYCDENHQWHYALHPRDKDVVFPKYGFMLLPAILAKKRILEKKYIPFMPSVEQALLLDNIWSTSILESITEDSSILFSSLTPEVATRLQQLEVDWLSFCEWQDTVEERLEGLQTQIATHEIAIVEVKQNVVVQHAQLSRLQRNVIEISESRRFTYIPKPYFQPRKNLWRLLEQRFSQEKTMSPIAVVGSGGMGKTSLISQWAEKQKFSGKYHSIRRMVMDEISMEGSLVDLACDLSITVEKRKKEDWLKEVVQRLREQSWLIIWDNVENHAAIEFLLPYFIQNEDHNVTQHLVITSRDTTCWENPIMVDTFSSEESLAYIEHQMKAAANPWFNPQEAQKLANCFEHHPLALELAMGHVCLYQRSLDTYLQELQAVGISTLKAPGQKIVSQARINTDKLTMLWKMGLERLTSDAILLLRFMSFVGSQGVGRKLIINHFNGDEERCDEALLALRQQAFIKAAEPSNIKKSWAPIDETTGLMVIAGLEIPETSSEAWGIHRLIQEVVVDDTKQNWAGHWIDWKNFLTQAYSAIQITFPSETTNFNSMNNISLMRYLTYNRTFWYRITTAFNYTDATWVQFYLRWKAEFLLKFGTAESDFGLYEDAVKHLYEALSAYNSLGDDMPGLICVLTNLGNVHKHQGNHALALIFYNDSLIQARAFYGEKIQDSGIHIIFNNIGTILMAQRDYLNAIANFEQSIDVAHSLYGEEENYELVPPLINLAKILRTQGNHSRALELLESARHIAVVVFGGFSARPEISEILSELGHANSDQGQYAKACIFFTESLKNYRIYYQQSENHPNIAKALYDLAEVYSSQDNYSDAIIYHNRSM